MPLIKSASKSAVSENIKREMAAGKSQEESVAIAMSVQREAKSKDAAPGANAPFPVRHQSVHDIRKGRKP